MILTEAIEILGVLESRSINNSTMFKKDALKLGIEALKHYQNDKKLGLIDSEYFLPGETEE